MRANNVDNNLLAYRSLFFLERLLRHTVEITLSGAKSEPWLHSIPPDVIQKCERRSVREKESYQHLDLEDADHVLNYADFKDLKTVILSNWDVFEAAFGRKDVVEGKLAELEIPRNTIAHNRMLSETELHRIDVYTRDIIRCIQRIEPDLANTCLQSLEVSE